MKFPGKKTYDDRPSIMDVVAYRDFKYKLLLDDEPFGVKRKSPRQALQEFENNYPKNRIWHLAVDGRLLRVEHGWVNYENRENGSLKAFFKGLNAALKDFDNPLISTSLIHKLHHEVSKDVKNINQGVNPGHFRGAKDYAHFSINTDKRGTPEGFADLLDKIESGQLGDAQVEVLFLDSPYFREHKFNQKTAAEFRKQAGVTSNLELATKALKGGISSHYGAPSGNEVEALLAQVMNHYNNTIGSLTSDDDILQLIGETIQAFERIHPYGDANGRTFVNLLLNRLLLQNGFPPATFYEPNLFDTHGHLVDILKRGIKNTLAIYEGKDVFGFKMHQVMTPTELEFFNMDELARFRSNPPRPGPIVALLDENDNFIALSHSQIAHALDPLSTPAEKLEAITEAYEKIMAIYKNQPLDKAALESIHNLQQMYIQVIKDVPFLGKDYFATDYALKEINVDIDRMAAKPFQQGPIPHLLDFSAKPVSHKTNERKTMDNLLKGIGRDLSFLCPKDHLLLIQSLISTHPFVVHGLAEKLIVKREGFKDREIKISHSAKKIHNKIEELLKHNPIERKHVLEMVDFIHKELDSKSAKRAGMLSSLPQFREDSTVELYRDIIACADQMSSSADDDDHEQRLKATDSTR